jgi:NAD(P)H-binding
MMKRCVFVAGGTGYLGRPLIERLLKRGHEVRALVRAGSERRLPVGCQVIEGNALSPQLLRWADRASRGIYSAGRSRTSEPGKGRTVLAGRSNRGAECSQSGNTERSAAFRLSKRGVPRPGYESLHRSARRVRGSNLRRWFECYDSSPVVRAGAGTSLAILAGSRILADGRLPATRDAALRLGLVTLQQMVNALVTSVEDDRRGIKIMGVPEILAAGSV